MAIKRVSEIKIAQLEGAIMVYDTGFAEYRPIADNKFGLAEPLSERFVRKIVEGFDPPNKRMRFRGPIPEKCFYANSVDNFNLIWRFTEKRMKLVFTQKKHSGTYFIPNLIFQIKENGFFVYIYKKWEKEETEIYHLKFPNISSSGMCMGSAKLHLDKCEYFEDAMKNGEIAFFESKFSHTPTITMEKLKGAHTFDYDSLEDPYTTIDGIL